jgi:SAM-dependent methyltransferase
MGLGIAEQDRCARSGASGAAGSRSESLADVQATFESLGKTDPLWGVLTHKRRKHNRWDPADFFETGRVEIQEVMQYCDALGLEIRRERALDFGCAVGRLTQPLCEYFQDVVGVDIAASFLDCARQYNRYGERCRYLHNTRNDLALLESESLDFIYTRITLQHMPAVYSVRYIAEFFRLLRPGGVAVFQVPSGWTPFDGSAAWILRRLRWLFIAPCKRAGKRLLGQPVIGMYPVARRDVEAIVRSNGARMVDVIENDASGKGWVSLRYCATKDRPRN